MQAQGVLFINSSVLGSSVLGPIAWPGGRSAFTFSATQYGLTVTPQIQAYNGKWIPICSSIVADQIFPFDAPAGAYRIVQAGSSVGMSATLTMTY